ncbi:thioesterase [Marinomonas sp. SBI22]|uniref:acyl-CoA thioesterase n=1 Tax=unclassified Marinomonas TaxID=196814 RepID=UPI0007AF9D2A|nr:MULTISPECIES: thioesterase family protein [unclassified Marinomonas]KZM41419.1 thioesterase [Marinomonas sp. SBI22]KZM43255.1 thioesterase [Marinomonas sp. SBI8L]
MLVERIVTRFSDTDGLGHINNTMLPVWFEGARNPIFQIFTPDLSLKKWQLILAKFDVEFHGELFYGEDIELRSGISRIGSSSFDVYQEAWQDGRKCASGTAVHVHFDHEEKASKPLSDDLKEKLLKHPFSKDD